MYFPRQPRRRSSQRSGRFRFSRANLTSMSIVFLVGFIVPLLLHGMSLFFTTFLPLIVLAASPIVMHIATLAVWLSAVIIGGSGF